MLKSNRVEFLVVLVSLLLLGSAWQKSGPSTADEKSTSRSSLEDRIKFVEKYVKFRRNYEKLDYHIQYQNNGGGFVPGPSDWDIRLIAQVPAKELNDWIPANSEKSDKSVPAWVTELPGEIEREGITEWHKKANVTVGIDRERSVVVYRNLSTPD